MRLFVAAHVAAVAGLYALALALGDGLAPPPFQPDAARSPHRPAAGQPRVDSLAALAQAPAQAPEAHAPSAARAGPVPAWAERPEVRAPWEGR